MAGRAVKWGGIAIRGHTCCTPAHHTPDTAFMDAPVNGHMQSYQNTHFLQPATQRQTKPVLISDFGTFFSPLPMTSRPSTWRSASSGGTSGDEPQPGWIRLTAESIKSGITTHLTKHWGVPNPSHGTIRLMHSYQTQR